MKTKNTSNQFAALISCYIIYILIYVCRINLSTSVPILEEELILTTEQTGMIAGAFSIIYACGRFFSGWICDIMPSYLMIALGTAICGISNMLCGSLPPFYMFLLFWGLNAAAQSILWGSILKVIASIYQPEKAKKVSSYFASSVAAGNITGILLTTTVIQSLGLTYAFLIPGGITLLFALIAYIFIKPVHTRSKAVETGNYPVLKDRALHKMMIPAIVHGTMKDNIVLWMSIYVLDCFGLRLDKSIAYILAIHILGLIGRISAPSLYKLCRSSDLKLITFSFTICSAAILALVIIPTERLNVWFAVFCLSLAFMSVSIINISVLAFFPIRYAPYNKVASVSGILDLATYLGSGVSSFIYGITIQNWGYNSMFISWIVLSLLSLSTINFKADHVEI